MSEQVPSTPGGTPLERIGRRMEALGKQRHLLAVRDGVIAALPLILVGSTFLLLIQPPSETLAAWLAPHAAVLKVPYRMLGGCLALYVTFACAHSLARSYALDPLASALTAVAGFLVASPTALLAPPATGWGLAADRLGAGGMFGGFAIAIASVELGRFLAARSLTIRLPGGAPEAIVRSFAALVPTLATVVGVWLVVHVAGFDLLGLVARAVAPLLTASDTLPAAWVVVGIDSGMGLFGLHPAAALAALKPVWLQMLAENMAAAEQNLPLPHLGGHEFFLWFVFQGGSGGTLGAALALLFSQSATLKGLSKVALLPALFNINEPLVFGLPVVLNPTLAFPFVVAPLVTATTTWFAMDLGWVARPRLEVLWTLPAPLGAWLTTGGDIRAVVLQLLNLAVTIAIWWPFLRRHDRNLLARERQGAAAPPSDVSKG